MGAITAMLPEFMSQQPVVAQVLSAIEAEVTLLEAQIESIQRELYISTSRARIKYWERELDLASRKDLTEAERSSTALVAFSQWDTCTAHIIKQIVARIIGVIPMVTEVSSAGKVVISAEKNGNIFAHMPLCQAAVEGALPAHIISEINAKNDATGTHDKGYFLHGSASFIISE